MTQNFPVIKLLVAKGADPNLGFKPKEGPGPLHLAVSKNDLDLAKLLLAKGADINARDDKDATPLHYAAATLRLEIVKLLVEKGADINARFEKQYTPIDVVGVDALANKNDLSAEEETAKKEIIALLKSKGAKDDPAKRSRFLSLGLQGEAKTNLAAIYTMQVSYFGEYDKYGLTFKDLEWEPQGESRYAYFVGKDVIQPTLGGPYQLPPGVKSEVTAKGFTIIAVGNIDGDPTLDVWMINDAKILKNLVNDVEK
jgi:hypothetical protein